MINQNGEAATLLIVVCSLIQLALVIGDSQSNINSESTIAAADINNKYLSSTRDEKKSLSERWTKGNREEWRKPDDDEDDNKWIDYSSTSIIHERLHPTMNVAGEGLVKMNKSNISREQSDNINNTNPSRTTPLSIKLISDYNNGLKIAPFYYNKRITKRSRQQPRAAKKRRQLSLSTKLSEKTPEDNNYKDENDSSDSLIIPISLFDYDNSDGEEYYEEMDELLKLKRTLNNAETNIKKQKLRGDMNPMTSSFTEISDEEKLPIRGDIVTRKKRSYNNDELWGYGEDEGYVSSDEINTRFNNITTATIINNAQTINQSTQEEHGNQSNPTLAEENKLIDYIKRNQPIIVPNRGKNNRKPPRFPITYSRKNQLSENEWDDKKVHNIMEQKSPAETIFNYDLVKINDEQKRINNIPVSARIIITKDPSSSLSSIIKPPDFISRGNFDDDINFPGINPDRVGLKVKNFPAPRTQSPLKQSPSSCVWAIVQCCPSNMNNRQLTKCFEYMNCPGINWDPTPCRKEITESAQMEIIKYFSSKT
ncbi:hypothetical protein PV327_009861 [Microctonus hyperodae]|uniref:Uncharacterized protein n=1 Tax=Microctonus hyperodae TaxID=165561 RepID=A0AA39F1U8_MICHY|nr:hypothetical protein PV327_009861 [Microctonus hyperodae]